MLGVKALYKSSAVITIFPSLQYVQTEVFKGHIIRLSLVVVRRNHTVKSKHQLCHQHVSMQRPVDYCHNNPLHPSAGKHERR